MSTATSIVLPEHVPAPPVPDVPLVVVLLLDVAGPVAVEVLPPLVDDVLPPAPVPLVELELVSTVFAQAPTPKRINRESKLRIGRVYKVPGRHTILEPRIYHSRPPVIAPDGREALIDERERSHHPSESKVARIDN